MVQMTKSRQRYGQKVVSKSGFFFFIFHYRVDQYIFLVDFQSLVNGLPYANDPNRFMKAPPSCPVVITNLKFTIIICKTSAPRRSNTTANPNTAVTLLGLTWPYFWKFCYHLKCQFREKSAVFARQLRRQQTLQRWALLPEFFRVTCFHALIESNADWAIKMQSKIICVKENKIISLEFEISSVTNCHFRLIDLSLFDACFSAFQGLMNIPDSLIPRCTS